MGGSGQQSPYQQYVGALDAATGDKVRMRRYVKLFSPEEFLNRSYSVQRAYVSWLKNQYNMLARNPNYVLADVVRAPQWGSKLARIVTHDAMMEITGDGDAAILLTDDDLCETIRRYARESVVGREALNKPTYYGHGMSCDKNVEQFKKKFGEIERLMKPKSGEDEESET